MAGRANDGRPWLALNPGAIAPVVLTCEHATNRLPFRRGVGGPQREMLARHWGWDIGAWAVTRELARRLGATTVGGRWSRLLVDLNRRATDDTLLRERVDGVPLPWNAGLSPLDVERRLARYHTPYHAEIDRLVVRHLVRGVRPLLFSVHSFTDVYEGRHRPFDVGVLYERDRAPAWRLGRRLRREGLEVRYNEPYSGMAGMMYSIDRHALHHRLPCMELELNQALFDDPRAARRLGRLVAEALDELVERSRLAQSRAADEKRETASTT